ncbi:MAG: hypothetical protein AAGU13_20295, partial [Stutzerimonas stutzeri]
KPWAWPIWMVARSSTLSSVYDIGAAPYRKGQVLHSVFAAAWIRIPHFQLWKRAVIGNKVSEQFHTTPNYN